MSPSLSSDRTRVGLPEIEMSPPACRFSSAISSATFSPMSVELFHSSGSSRVVETTYLRTPFMWPATGFSSGSCCGQDAAHEHGVRLAHRRPYLLTHLVAPVREMPLVRRLHDAVQRDELGHDHPSHVRSPFRYRTRDALRRGRRSPRLSRAGISPIASERSSCRRLRQRGV